MISNDRFYRSDQNEFQGISSWTVHEFNYDARSGRCFTSITVLRPLSTRELGAIIIIKLLQGDCEFSYVKSARVHCAKRKETPTRGTILESGANTAGRTEATSAKKISRRAIICKSREIVAVEASGVPRVSCTISEAIRYAYLFGDSLFTLTAILNARQITISKNHRARAKRSR